MCVLRVLERRQREESLTECVCVCYSGREEEESLSVGAAEGVNGGHDWGLLEERRGQSLRECVCVSCYRVCVDRGCGARRW